MKMDTKYNNLCIMSLWFPPAMLSVTSKIDTEYMKGVIPAEQKREKKKKKGNNPRSENKSNLGFLLYVTLLHPGSFLHISPAEGH